MDDINYGSIPLSQMSAGMSEVLCLSPVSQKSGTVREFDKKGYQITRKEQYGLIFVVEMCATNSARNGSRFWVLKGY